MSYPASHKKDPGIIKLERDRLEWKSNASSKSVSIPFAVVSSLKASPPQAAQQKIMVIAQFDGQEAPQNFQFAFPDRVTMDTVKGLVQQAVQGHRSETPSAPPPNAVNTPSPAQAPAQSSTMGLDAKSLLKNTRLQTEFLRENRDLMRAFRSAVIEGGLDHNKFWESRTNMLRAYALSSSQQRGAYNVLGTIKPTNTSDNTINVSLTREKIHDIFEQYPIVSQAYNDTVPSRMSEGEFWQRFFLSRLFRRLRGEMVTATHIVDPVLDIKYLDMYEKEDMGVYRRNKRSAQDDVDGELVSVPAYLDIEGNEASDPQRLGNLPDITMQAGRDKNTVSLIRSVNSLSQRMTYGSHWRQPVLITGDSEGDKDEDIALEHQLQLGDLKNDAAEDTRVHLELARSKLAAEEAHEIKNFAERVVDLNSQEYKSLFGFLHGGEVDLRQAGSDPDQLRSAEANVKAILNTRSQELDQSDERWRNESSTELLDQVQMCHTTSVEFLNHFWTAFLSGDPSQASSLAKLVDKLKKSYDRIDAVVASAPSPEHSRRARSSLTPLTKSLNVALARYQTAVDSAAAASAATPI